VLGDGPFLDDLLFLEALCGFLASLRLQVSLIETFSQCIELIGEAQGGVLGVLSVWKAALLEA